MVQPLVSIVTPSYNQAQFLEATIRSVLDQDYPRIEYIVVDGGSTDGSAQIVERYADRLAFWVSEPDRGQSHGINKGLARATGDIIGWLNSDDTLLPGAVSRIVQAMPAAPALVHGPNQLIDEAGNVVVRPRFAKRQREFGVHTIIDDGLVNQPGAFWNRAAMDAAGLLDESLTYIMDYDYWVRMALAGARFVRLADPPLATYRLAADTKTIGGMARMGLEKLTVLDRLLADPALPLKTGLSSTELQRHARRARAFACLKIFRGHARTPGRRAEAMGWLLKATRLYPPSLLLFPEYAAKKAGVVLAHRLGKTPPSW